MKETIGVIIRDKDGELRKEIKAALDLGKPVVLQYDEKAVKSALRRDLRSRTVKVSKSVLP